MSAAPAQPLRILLVSHYYPPHIGGIEGVAQQEALRLAADGAQVTVLTTGPRSGVAEEQGVTVVRVAAWNGFEKHGIPFPVPTPFTLLRQARRWARWADVIHVHDSFYLTSWAAWLVSAASRTPMVATQHVALVQHPVRLVHLIQRLVYATMGRRVLRRARVVFTLNGRVEQFVHSLGVSPDATRHLPNGVDAELFHPARDAAERKAVRAARGLPEDAVLVLFAGRLVPRKGVDLLLEARDASYRLVLAGPGDTAVLRGREDVHYLGALPATEIAPLMRACDVLALPTTVNEGFPLSVQEAMSSGLPVVTTDDPGYAPYGLDRDRIALIPRETEALRASLRDLALDGDLRAAMGAYCSAYAAEHFAWAEHVATLAECYRSVMP
jgi:glycosyltransferase involved in cell wall biosynthesis